MFPLPVTLDAGMIQALTATFDSAAAAQPRFHSRCGGKKMRKSVASIKGDSCSVIHYKDFHSRADIIFQKSIKKRAEAVEMMEKEMADTEARQEKVGHKLKERIGK